MKPCLLIHRYQSFGETSYLNFHGKGGKLEVSGFSETSAPFFQSAQHRVPDDNNHAVNIILTTKCSIITDIGKARYGIFVTALNSFNRRQ
jgi:hypothetical protein